MNAPSKSPRPPPWHFTHASALRTAPTNRTSSPRRPANPSSPRRTASTPAASNPSSGRVGKFASRRSAMLGSRSDGYTTGSGCRSSPTSSTRTTFHSRPSGTRLKACGRNPATSRRLRT